MKKFVLFAAVALILAACSSEEPTSLPNKSNETAGHNPYRVTLNDALKTADVLLDDIAGDAQTRSGKQRRVASVEYMTNPGTRASGSDTLLYLVNYADDAGFALLSADSRLRPVYAISDEGTLSFADTTYNKGLALFARGVEADVVSSMTFPSLPSDSAIYVPPTDPQPEIKADTIRSVKDRVRPMLSSYQRNWSQSSPFNRYCFTTEGAEAQVGCTAVAGAQIMAYHKWPEQYGGYTFDWNEINNGNIDMLARFLRLLGNSENLNISYGVRGSSAYHGYYYRTFDNMGYTYHTTFQNFNESDVCAFMKGTHSGGYTAGPILVRGAYPNNDGHAWVLDGYLQYDLTILVGSTSTFTTDDILYHCIWGWGDKNNGYYYWAKRQRFDGELIETDRYDNPPNDAWNFEYYYNIIYMAGFAPQKN